MSKLKHFPADVGADIISRKTSQDNTISWEATGMLTYLISMPEGWKIKTSHLAALREAGKDKVMRILRELEEAGYIYRKSTNSKDGTWVWVTELYHHKEDNPHNKEDNKHNKDDNKHNKDDNKHKVTQNPVTVKPLAVNTLTGKALSIENLDLENLDLENLDNLSPLSEILQEYEQAIGLVTPQVREMIAKDINSFPSIWIKEAIEETKERGGNSYAYSRRILETWRDTGRAAARSNKPNRKRMSDGYHPPEPGVEPYIIITEM